MRHVVSEGKQLVFVLLPFERTEKAADTVRNIFFSTLKTALTLPMQTHTLPSLPTPRVVPVYIKK